MSMLALSPTAQRALDAYGGAEIWEKAKNIKALVNVNGLAFSLKRRPFFKQAEISMSVHECSSSISPIGNKPGIAGHWQGDSVSLVDANGKVLETRQKARSYFPLGRRLFYWDDLDMAYFANYAFWNYFTFPNLLSRPGILWEEKKAGHLRATFPTGFPTHSKVQDFYFDLKTGLLLQHNYAANVISKFANAANRVLAHQRNEQGLLYPSIRKVTPQGFGAKALGGPTLIYIEVLKWQLS